MEALIGYPDEPPMGMINFGYGDPNAAIHGLVPLLAAIYETEATGRGQHIDMSQIETLLSVIAEPLIDNFMNHRDAAPTGNRHPSMAPHGIYPAAGTDRLVSIAVADDAQWNALVEWDATARLGGGAGIGARGTPRGALGGHRPRACTLDRRS